MTEYTFENDALYRYTPVHPEIPEIGKKELVITKDEFLMCYRKWVCSESKPESEGTMVIHVDNAIKEMKNLNAGELEIAATHIRGDKTYKTTTIISLEETDETEDYNDED